jgi:hydroxyquinol 1,2-dioxygenase
MKARGRLRTDAQGRYSFWSIRPEHYPVPSDGPVGVMLRKMGRHAMRPGHIHMIVSAPGHHAVTTHLFAAGSQYLDSDAVFGVKDSLVTAFRKHESGVAPDGSKRESPFYTVNFDFRLRPKRAA